MAFSNLLVLISTSPGKKFLTKGRKTPVLDRLSGVFHCIQIERKIVMGDQSGCKHFAGLI